MKVAVIGAGVSGLSAALFISQKHEVTLYEADSRLGGHAHTINIRLHDGREFPVDTGFMVFNPLQYPHFTKLIKYLGVKTIATSMSFSVSLNQGVFEYSSNVPNGIFADKQNMLRVSFHSFLQEIIRFNAVALKALEEGIDENSTLHEFLVLNRFSRDFEERYVIPLVGSIWSTPKRLARVFPTKELLTFLHKHHLLAVVGHPKWETILGGSQEYVRLLNKRLEKNNVHVHTQARVFRVARNRERVEINTSHGQETFDFVVFGTHADTALSLLETPTAEEQSILSQFQYEENEVYVHEDVRLMPRRREAWASWNYLGSTGWGSTTKKVCLTYHMNELQHIKTTTPILITLNPYDVPAKQCTYAHMRYRHPLMSVESAHARNALKDLQNKNRTLFCGSYFGYGFHEDGIASAVDAARYLDTSPPWEYEK